jgi:hypothetical protein
MPNNYWEKIECWDSLLGLVDTGYTQNCIIVGDFNTTVHFLHGSGSSTREKMEDLMFLWT